MIHRLLWPRVLLAALLAASAIALGGCDQIRPFEELCEERLAPARIEVEAAPIEVTTDFSRSREQLTAAGAPSAGRTVLGLTETQIKWSVAMGGNALTRRIGGRHCLRPDVKVRLSMEPMTVSIANEYPPGTCSFDLTMAHEQKHVQVYQVFLFDVTKRVQEQLRARFGERVLYFASAAEADKHLSNLTRDTLSPLVGNAMQEVTPLQTAVDSPEEYFRLDRFQEACAGR